MPGTESDIGQDGRSQLKAWLEEGMRWRGWRMPQLAKDSGVSRGTISRLINCKIDPSEDTVAKLAKALNRPTPGTAGSLIIQAYEALNILQDAVNRARMIMNGDADPALEPAPGLDPKTRAALDEAMNKAGAAPGLGDN